MKISLRHSLCSLPPPFCYIVVGFSFLTTPVSWCNLLSFQLTEYRTSMGSLGESVVHYNDWPNAQGVRWLL